MSQRAELFLLLRDLREMLVLDALEIGAKAQMFQHSIAQPDTAKEESW